MGVPQALISAAALDELLKALLSPAMNLLLAVHPVGALDALEGAPPHAENLALHRVVVVEEAVEPAGDLTQQLSHRCGPALIDVQPARIVLVVGCDDASHDVPVPLWFNVSVTCRHQSILIEFCCALPVTVSTGGRATSSPDGVDGELRIPSRPGSV